MSRRKHRSPVVAASWVAWRAEFEPLFSQLAPKEWERPDRVSCRQTKTGYTLIGVFDAGAPVPAKVTLRLRKGQTGWSLAGSNLSMIFRSEPAR